MEEYELAFIEASYKDPGKQLPMVFIATGGGFHDGNAYH